MGNITELSQGNLDGLKKQVCECIDHAQAQGYKKGYEKGQNDADNDLKEIQDSTYDVAYRIAYSQALEDVNYFFIHADVGFIMECFPDESSFNLFDLMKKYGLEVIVKKYKKWQEQKKQAEVENYKLLTDTLRNLCDEYDSQTMINALSEFGFKAEVDE